MLNRFNSTTLLDSKMSRIRLTCSSVLQSVIFKLFWHISLSSNAQSFPQDDIINLDFSKGECRNQSVPQNVTFSYQVCLPCLHLCNPLLNFVLCYRASPLRAARSAWCKECGASGLWRWFLSLWPARSLSHRSKFPSKDISRLL